MVADITRRPDSIAVTNRMPNEEFNSVIKVTVSFLALFGSENEPFSCKEEGKEEKKGREKKKTNPPTTDMMNLGIMCLNKEWQQGTFLF